MSEITYNPQRAGKTLELEKDKPDWPELQLDEEFLRIVLLESRVMGKDVTVEPYKSWNDELEWRRTDKYLARDAKDRPLSVEQVREWVRAIHRMDEVFSSTKDTLHQQIRNHLCSHKYADGTDATTGVPVSGERWCNACKAQFD